MPEPRRALRILYVYYEPSPSGQTEHILSLVQRLDRQRFEVTVALPTLLESQADNYRAAGARVVSLPIRKLLWHPGAISGLIAEVRREKYDLVHVHSQEAGLVARILARLGGGCVILYTPHTINIRRKNWQPIYTFAENLLSRITDRILTVNEADRRSLIERGIPGEKVVAVHNGVDLAKFDPQIPPPAPALALRETGGPLVMQVGRISEQKAPLDFIEGARIVLQTMPDARFALVGGGPLLEKVRARIRAYGLEGQISAPGAQPDAFRWIQVADLITLTSYWEGSPYSLLEAMAWRKPVVATAVNGCPELVLDGETGYLVPPGQPRAWARQVLRLIQDPKSACKMGENGRRHLEANFTLPRMVTTIQELYEQWAR